MNREQKRCGQRQGVSRVVRPADDRTFAIADAAVCSRPSLDRLDSRSKRVALAKEDRSRLTIDDRIAAFEPRSRRAGLDGVGPPMIS